MGTHKGGAPYFEALRDASGWLWYILLHDSTNLVGVVQNQDVAAGKKRDMAKPSTRSLYQQSLDLVPGSKALLSRAELASD